MSAKTEILKSLLSGDHLTPLNMLIRFKTLAGGQRCNELAKLHPQIKKRFIDVIAPSGAVKRVREYWWEEAP